MNSLLSNSATGSRVSLLPAVVLDDEDVETVGECSLSIRTPEIDSPTCVRYMTEFGSLDKLLQAECKPSRLTELTGKNPRSNQDPAPVRHITAFGSQENLLQAEYKPFRTVEASPPTDLSGYFVDSGCEESDVDVNLNPSSMQSSYYEKRLSELCATEDVVYRAPSRERIHQLHNNRKGVCFKDPQEVLIKDPQVFVNDPQEETGDASVCESTDVLSLLFPTNRIFNYQKIPLPPSICISVDCH